MKKYAILFLASAFAMSVSVMAQDNMPEHGRKGDKKEFKKEVSPEAFAQKRAEKMAKDLNLSDAEKVKVQALFEKQAAMMQQHKAEMQKIREKQMAKVKKERIAQQAELEKIIGSDKYHELQVLREQKAQKMKEGMQRARARMDERRGNRMDQMKFRMDKRREMQRNDSTNNWRKEPKKGMEM